MTLREKWDDALTALESLEADLRAFASGTDDAKDVNVATAAAQAAHRAVGELRESNDRHRLRLANVGEVA